MGYSTDFYGSFKTSRQLSDAERDYLNALAGTRRMKRDVSILSGKQDPFREALGIPLGVDGEFYVGRDNTGVIDVNSPPGGQPDLYNQWIMDSSGWYLGWDGQEKFNYYVEWLKYLIENFFKPWDVLLRGVVRFQGEEESDCGVIVAGDHLVEQIYSIPMKTLPVATHVDYHYRGSTTNSDGDNAAQYGWNRE
jgi:hypothetical protein